MPLREVHFLQPWSKLAVRLPDGSEGKEYACNAGDPGSIPGSGRSPEEWNGNPLYFSCLENSKDRGLTEQLTLSLLGLPCWDVLERNIQETSQ